MCIRDSNYPDGSLNITSVTERDFEYLAFGIEQRVDYVAVSFVRSVIWPSCK